jgi:RimJ/RimL family protein N-acetyltransferase
MTGVDTVLETERLRLRRLTWDDLDDLAAILGDPDVMRYYRKPFGRVETRGWIRWNLDLYTDHGFGLWAVILKENGMFVGDCGLTIQVVDGEEEVEVGYHVKKMSWGHGLATEAAAACRDYAFDVLGRDRLIAIIDPENAASRRVAEKIGMTVEKQVVRHDRRQLIYSMTNTAERTVQRFGGQACS